MSLPAHTSLLSLYLHPARWERRAQPDAGATRRRRLGCPAWGPDRERRSDFTFGGETIWGAFVFLTPRVIVTIAASALSIPGRGRAALSAMSLSTRSSPRHVMSHPLADPESPARREGMQIRMSAYQISLQQPYTTICVQVCARRTPMTLRAQIPVWMCRGLGLKKNKGKGDPERSPVDHSRRVVATSSADTVSHPHGGEAGADQEQRGGFRGWMDSPPPAHNTPNSEATVSLDRYHG